MAGTLQDNHTNEAIYLRREQQLLLIALVIPMLFPFIINRNFTQRGAA